MEWAGEFQSAFQLSVRRMTKPRVFMPAVLIIGLAQGFGLGVSGAALGLMQQEAGLERLSAYGGLFWLLGMGLLACGPAAVSGFMCLAERATEDAEQGWRDFWGGVGKYYWRVVGVYLLVAAAAIVFGLTALGGYSSWAAGQAPKTSFFWQAVSLAVEYLFTAWTAVMAIDGANSIASLGGAVRFAWAKPAFLAPAFLLQKASEWAVDRVSSTVVLSGPYGPAAPLWSGRMVAGLLTGALSGWIYMLFMLVYFQLYRTSKGPDRPTGPGPAPGE